MTRTDFIKEYAARSGLTSEWAAIGILDAGSRTMFAMPCACGEEGCDGWAMMSGENVLYHLYFRAPDVLVSAYHESLRLCGGV